MKILKIEPGCIACGACQFFVPQVFHVSDIAQIKKGADLEKHHNEIKEAVRQCPVGVINYKNQIDKKRE